MEEMKGSWVVEMKVYQKLKLMKICFHAHGVNVILLRMWTMDRAVVDDEEII